MEVNDWINELVLKLRATDMNTNSAVDVQHAS